jgi:hypothetical protein
VRNGHDLKDMLDKTTTNKSGHHHDNTTDCRQATKNRWRTIQIFAAKHRFRVHLARVDLPTRAGFGPLPSFLSLPLACILAKSGPAKSRDLRSFANYERQRCKPCVVLANEDGKDLVRRQTPCLIRYSGIDFEMCDRVCLV